MLEEIGHTKLMEWVAFVELEQEEAEKARKKAESGGGSNGNRIVNTTKFN